MNGPIKKNRKRHARSIRKGVGNKLQDGRVETHKMEWGQSENKKGKKVYHVNPSIAFDKKGKVKPQTYRQAVEAGEVYEFKNKKKAERFAAGSWKKGKAKREAMKAYRQTKKRKSNPYM
jgi:hypothetical protein